MTPDVFLRDIVDPSLKKLADWTGLVVTDQARVLVIAIAGQESGWSARRQNGGPARSYWQFEQGGGVAGLVRVAPVLLSNVCASLDIPFSYLTQNSAAVFEAMAWNDTLACCMARLLLWTDPRPLPDVGQQDAAWDYYVRNWRPGAPRPDAWPARYGTALTLVKA